MQSCEWLHFLFCDKVFPYSIKKFEKSQIIMYKLCKL